METIQNQQKVGYTLQRKMAPETEIVLYDIIRPIMLMPWSTDIILLLWLVEVELVLNILYTVWLIRPLVCTLILHDSQELVPHEKKEKWYL